MISTDKQMIRIPTDPTNLTTDCIGLSSSRPKKHRGRGRPKGSKSKTKSKRTGHKRSATESHLPHTESSYIHHPKPTPSFAASQPPKRKKRKPNRAHREAFPHHTDEDIRRQLALERKAKNRKSAQESRERRKKQEQYLNDRLPKGLALKSLLKSDKLIEEADVHEVRGKEEEQSEDDTQLSQMKMILDQMVDNQAVEYDQYANVLHHKSAISDELIFDILSDYLDANVNHEDALQLETDHNPIHLQVIAEIENGIPMQMDDIPDSATPISSKATRGRKPKNSHKGIQPLKTPPTLPQMVDTELPPPVFGVGSVDFNIDSESAVSLYPMPQDTMLNHYHFQSLYNASNPPCIIKPESSHFPIYPPMSAPPHINPHPHHLPTHSHLPHLPHPHSEQTPSTISTNSTISNAPTTTTHTTTTNITIPHTNSMKGDVDELQEKVLMSLMHPMTMTMTMDPDLKAPKAAAAATAITASPTQPPTNPHTAALMAESPLYTTPPITPCLHTPEQMHFIHPLPARVPHSPIIRVTAQQDTEETKQMLMDGLDIMKHNGNNGLNGRSSRNGNNLSSINNGERVCDLQLSPLDPMEEMRILSILVQIVQSFIIIICGMAMAINLSVDAMKHQYQNKINKATEDLRILVMDFMRKRLDRVLTTAAATATVEEDTETWRVMEWMEVQQHIIQSYLPEIMETIKSHPLMPNTRTMDVSLHYQAYRQIAMEILQNMKQQSIQYQMRIEKEPQAAIKCEAEEEEAEREEQEQEQEDMDMEMEMMMIGFDPQPIPACIPMMGSQPPMKRRKEKEMKIEQDLMHPLDLNQDCTSIQWRSICSEYQMHTPCFEEFQIHPMDYSTHSLQSHLIKYKQILQNKCFKILLDKKKD